MNQPRQQTLAEHLKAHHQTRPHMQIQDIYKLLYQAYMGIGHLIADQDSALAYLRRECEALSTLGGDEPLWEPISLDGAVGRVNLRPFLHSGMELESLAAALMDFAQHPPGTKQQLQTAWQDVGHLMDAGQLTLWPVQEFRDLTEQLEQNDYPAMHHSAAYRKAYRPAYRILPCGALQKLLRGIKPGDN